MTGRPTNFTMILKGGLEAHCDTVGAINISFVYQGRTEEPADRGSINRVTAHQEVVLLFFVS